MMRPLLRVTGAGSLLLLAASASANDLERGQQIASGGNGKGAVACASCHGTDGAGNGAAGFPRLAGLNGDYLARQIADFKTGSRNNAVMKPIAAALSAEGAAAVATYYAQATTQTGSKPPSVSPAALERGRRLAEIGDWDKGLPACVSCHGPDGAGVSKTFPRLTGQHAGYITGQIEAWQNGTRRNDPVDLMKTVADKLSESDVAAVSAYFAGLKQQ